MKILSIGNFGHGWDGSICDEEHIAGALEELGHEVTRWQRESTIDKEMVVWEYKTFDFILIAQWSQYEHTLIPMLKRDNPSTPIVYWAFDYQNDGQEWHDRLIAESDLYLSKRIADSKYPNWQWLSQDFAPSFLDKAARGPHFQKDIDVLFTGTYLPWATERNEILKAVDEQYDLHIYSVNPAEWLSAGFKHVNGSVMDDALPALIARAKVNLSIDHTYEAGYWSDRVAQILCCGGLVLHRYQPMCEIPFKNKVAYFSDIDECLFQINRLLEMPEEDADLCRRVGYEYADEFLRVNNRVEDLLTIVQGIL